MKHIILFLLLIPVSLVSAQTLQTTQPTNYLREGPASYYNVIAAISKGVNVDVLTKQGAWYKVKARADVGWISENSFTHKEQHQGQDEQLMKGKVSSHASRAELAAAVKGFVQKYSGGEESAVTNKYDTAFVSGDEMEKFEHSFTIEPYRNNPAVEKPFDLDFHEEEIGAGIAGKIAQQKSLSDNRQLVCYVNSIGMYLAQFTKAYDLGFRFIVLKDPQPCAYSCPGGYIFVSQSLIALCRNEAELAVILGHEMAHCIQRHGLKELKLSEPKIHAEQAFAELDNETGEQGDVEKELEAYAASAYDKIISPRLLSYELEADQLSMIYLRRAGYDPTAIVSLLERVNVGAGIAKTQANSYFQQADVQQRLTNAKRICDDESFSADFKRQFERRFVDMIKAMN